MFGLISKLLAVLFANALGLWLAGKFIVGVEAPIDLTITENIIELLIASIALTAINLTLRPILKLILSPLIILTLGLGIILINASMLFLLDYLMTSVTIAVPLPLLYTTLLMSAVNLIVRKL